MKLEMISKLIEFENADMGKVPPMAQPAALPPLSQVVPVAKREHPTYSARPSNRI